MYTCIVLGRFDRIRLKFLRLLPSTRHFSLSLFSLPPSLSLSPSAPPSPLIAITVPKLDYIQLMAAKHGSAGHVPSVDIHLHVSHWNEGGSSMLRAKHGCRAPTDGMPGFFRQPDGRQPCQTMCKRTYKTPWHAVGSFKTELPPPPPFPPRPLLTYTPTSRTHAHNHGGRAALSSGSLHRRGVFGDVGYA